MNIQYAMQSTISVKQPGSSSQSLVSEEHYIVASDIAKAPIYELANAIVIDRHYSIRKCGVYVRVCGIASYMQA